MDNYSKWTVKCEKVVSIDSMYVQRFHMYVHHAVPCTLNTQDNKVQLTSAFADVYQFHRSRRPGDVVWDVVRDGDDGVSWTLLSWVLSVQGTEWFQDQDRWIYIVMHVHISLGLWKVHNILLIKHQSLWNSSVNILRKKFFRNLIQYTRDSYFIAGAST